MNIFTFAMLILAAFSIQSYAQLTVEDDIVTDEVNIFQPDSQNSRSTALAMAASLAVPGMGHHYLGKQNSAFTFLAIDAVALLGALVLNNLHVRQEADARSFAVQNANIEKPLDNEKYWRQVGAQLESDGYNNMVASLRSGEIDDYYPIPGSWWHWNDEGQQDKFNSLRQKSRQLKVASYFFIGGMVLNRVISTVDLKVKSNRKILSSLEVEPSLNPDLSGASVIISGRF